MSLSLAIPTTTRAWVLQNQVEEDVVLSGPSATFALQTRDLPSEVPADSLLVQVLYISNDPAQKIWMQKSSRFDRPDMRALPEGTVFKAFVVGRVLAVGEESNEQHIHRGDLVDCVAEWAEYAVVKKAGARALSHFPGLSPSVYLGAFGLSGKTAYWGMVETLKLQKEHTLIVSGAAGAVGNVVVQYAKKVLGLKRVIAIAGSDDKCAWLKSLGADVAVNYKSATFEKELAEATAEYADAFFDNVGGSILDAGIARMKPHGIIAACGSVSTSYNDTRPLSLYNYMLVIMNRISITGFTVMDYIHRNDEAMAALEGAVKEGKLQVEGAETIVDLRGGFEKIPETWASLFVGANTGKLITKLAD